MHLIMFDIDDTLTQTCSAHCDCFVQAVCDTLGLPEISSDWERYRHVTDSGIAAEIIEATYSRAPKEGEMDRIRGRFVDLLQHQLACDETSCRPIAGAGELLTLLQARSDVAVALATGGWGQSARIKLAKANLPSKMPPSPRRTIHTLVEKSC
jgi:beta-phosphoglucomutase-like phosphatase (HAD superfamily)